MKTSKYIYPDSGDKLTTNMINRIELFPGYWSKSEQNALARAKYHIKRKLQPDQKAILFDVGCGEGRLLWEFEPYFANIIAIDPDAERIMNAQKTAEAKGLTNKISFQVATIDQVNLHNSVDVVLCSHVIQHVRTEYVSLLLKRVKEVLVPGGLLILTTCHSTNNQDYYVKQFWQNGHAVEERISSDEFDSLSTNYEGILPIHYFSCNSLKKHLLLGSLEILENRVFHIEQDFVIPAQVLDIDSFINKLYLRCRYGRDIIVIAQSQV